MPTAGKSNLASIAPRPLRWGGFSLYLVGILAINIDMLDHAHHTNPDISALAPEPARPWRELDVPEFDSIQRDLVPWVLSRFPDEGVGFWNHADPEDLFACVPLLPQAIHAVIGQIPDRIYVLIVSAQTREQWGITNERTLHRDTSEESCRLNWPVLNSTSIETRMYRSQSEPTKMYLPSDTSYLNYRIDQCEFVGSFRMHRPTVLRVHSIHALFHVPNTPLPRYILSFRFPRDISHMLDSA